MEKSNKKPIILIAVIAALVVILALVLWLINKEETYRIVKIYEIDGTATVNRQNTGEIEIYPNMVLASGDEVWLKEGLMTLKLDEDKFVYVEENTRFKLETAGSAADSKTSIELIEGAIVNEIRNPLSEDASYEVHTQNSSMSVRGTTFRVSIYYDEDGTMFTKVSVFEGKVETQLVFKDGTKADPRMVEFGKETIIFEDDTNTDYLEGITDIKYEQLSVSALETLLGLVKEGLSISADEAELSGMIEALKAEIKEENEDGSEELESEPDDDEDAEEDGEEDEGETEEGDSSDTSGDETDDTDDEEEPQPTSPEGNTITYTVTFMYDGMTFATQTVSAGANATCPTLMPAQSGEWEFNFSTVINEDTIVYWK